ncbi:MAG: hypothetical protein EOQ92_27575 [Mesorhizobium sp.]|uniref:hypothetical protein n=1 Tax=Mesorhizobium sp. TaxID=1871066 RepID=UPI000FE74870|nr:hypothetical protein [Mesorhizobium sp.]RWI15203.1 MAG: hypothetical protein EOQ92_27575 [Mesorhizobium sp.]TIQ26617.1 MAG: hypothetical protein E5X54_24960 [Mesorhizobium sp.]
MPLAQVRPGWGMVQNSASVAAPDMTFRGTPERKLPSSERNSAKATPYMKAVGIDARMRPGIIRKLPMMTSHGIVSAANAPTPVMIK